MQGRNRALRAVLFGSAIVLAGCAQGLPRRVKGSDITVPESGERVMLRSIASRCNRSTDTLDRDANHKADNRCGDAQGDTARSTTPPQKAL